MQPSNGWRPGPGEVGQGGQKVLHLWRRSQKIRTPQPKKFFSSANYKTCRFFWHFDKDGCNFWSGFFAITSVNP